MGKQTVIIHPTPDLDACTCVALAEAAMEDVHFLQGDATEIPVNCSCCHMPLAGKEGLRILDHPLGEKGRLDKDGTRHAAALSMQEAQHADPRLLTEVDEQDTTGRVRKPAFSLADILKAIRMEAGWRGLRDSELDREVVLTMSQIIRGINYRYHGQEKARRSIANAEMKKVGGFSFAAFPPGSVPAEVGTILSQEFDVTGTIYHHGYNIGVVRYPGRTNPDLRELEVYLPGWFIHSAGFIACWGTHKAMKSVPPPAGTPQSKNDLVKLLRRVYGKKPQTRGSPKVVARHKKPATAGKRRTSR